LAWAHSDETNAEQPKRGDANCDLAHHHRHHRLAPRLAALQTLFPARSYARPNTQRAMKTELRLTDTNAASDSQGKTWGLEGNLFWYLVGGLGAGITVFFLLIVAVKASLLISSVGAAVPVLLALAYIYGLRQGKPPGYDRDVVERLFTGNGFAPEPSRCSLLKHPLTAN
jgi:hypothetical protein